MRKFLALGLLMALLIGTASAALFESGTKDAQPMVLYGKYNNTIVPIKVASDGTVGAGGGGFQSDTSSGTLPSVPTNSTFIKNYGTTGNTSANADSSSGTGTATITATRSASAPATYIDIDGVITTTTTSNVARITQGYYDDLGFHSRRGLIVEGSSTNQIIQSAGLNDAAWVASNITVATNSVTAPDGAATADTLTASAANGTLIQTYTTGSAQYTASIFLKRKTGISPIFISANNGTTLVPCNVTDTNNWVRCQATATSANPTLYIQIASNTDAVYAWGGQLEAGAYASTYIPTTTTGLTRGTEKVSYPTSGNLTADGQTIFFKITPQWKGTDPTTNLTLFGTDTKNQAVNLNPSSDTFQFFPNSTDSASNINKGVGSTDKFKSMVIVGSYTASTPSANIYINGLLDASDTSNAITVPAWGTNFYIGSTNSGTAQIGSIIEEVRIYSGELTPAQVFAVSQAMGIQRKSHILVLGDSISAAGSGGAAENSWSYRKELQKGVGDKYLMVGNKASPTCDPLSSYYNNFSVRHAAVSGETSTQILARVPANLSQYFVPGIYNRGSAVIIQAGFNDITLDPQSNEALSITAAITNIKSMIDLVDAIDPEINIFVGKLTPRYDSSAFLWNLQRFNEELQNTRLTWTKKNVYIVDNYSPLFSNPNWISDYMYDNKHPKAEGFKIIGRQYSNAIKDLVNPVFPLKRYFSAYSAGTVYSLTNASAFVDFGTTDPTIQIDKQGTYVVEGGVQLKYNATTFAANQTATCKITRINNTPADLTGATSTIDLRILTTLTDNAGFIRIPPTQYTTFNIDDILQVYCVLSAAPGAGSVDAVSAYITASER